MIKSKIFDRLNLSIFGINLELKKLKKQVGLFEIDNINKPNFIRIALNREEYYEKFKDHTDNKKHKGLKKINTRDGF